VLFVPVWWAWVGYTFYADRFDTDDLVLRLAMLTAMLAVAWLAVEIPGVFESPGGAARFAAAYAAVRLVLVGLYLRAHYHEPQARPLTRRYIAGFTAGATLWLASAWVPSPARYVLWAIGVMVELTPPLLSSAAFRRVPFHISHIPERFAAFTIIALGETVLLVATGMGSEHLGAEGAVSAVFGFVVAACLWWLYFEFADATPLARRLLAPQTYAYGHLLVFAGITATGAGALLAIRAGADTLEPGGRWALCGGGAAFLSAIAAIQLANVGSWCDRRIWSRLTTAALPAALAGAGGTIAADALTISVAALLIATVLAEAALAAPTDRHVMQIERSTPRSEVRP
jgi:low temperature requirement protein LtrA